MAIPPISGLNYDIIYNTTSVVIIVTAALPVELLSFSAKSVDKRAELIWQTASEVNVKNYEIEKSFDGQKFEKIAQVKANNTPSVYQAFDDTFSQSAYYRLKMVDLDGSFDYSKIVFLEKETGGKTNIRWDGRGELFIETQDKIESVIVYNLLGQVLKSVKEQTLSISHLPSAIYLISVKTENGYLSKKIWKY